MCWCLDVKVNPSKARDSLNCPTLAWVNPACMPQFASSQKWEQGSRLCDWYPLRGNGSTPSQGWCAGSILAFGRADGSLWNRHSLTLAPRGSNCESKSSPSHLSEKLEPAGNEVHQAPGNQTQRQKTVFLKVWAPDHFFCPPLLASSLCYKT